MKCEYLHNIAYTMLSEPLGRGTFQDPNGLRDFYLTPVFVGQLLQVPCVMERLMLGPRVDLALSWNVYDSHDILEMPYLLHIV